MYVYMYIFLISLSITALCLFMFTRSMWSDTGSYDYESKGDITKVVNLDSYNLAGPVGGGFSSFRRKIQSG